jgi:iron complex outermembrane recepter protein
MSTNVNTKLSRAVRTVLLTGGALAAGLASEAVLAQAAPAQSAGGVQGAAIEEIVVTGSRIAAPNLEAISPVVAITAAEIRDSGTTRIEDVLNNLPSVVADQSSGLSMGSNGTATVNLRGLGAQRTLVLVNGRRLMGGDPGAPNQSNPGTFASAADLNQIPVALIERVDVLTGGASSTYGADAVAGVVNFVMNDHFEGVRVDANVGIYNHHAQHEDFLNPLLNKQVPPQPIPQSTNWDGANKDLTLILGHNFADGAGNATAYLGYRVNSPVTADHRNYAACVLLNNYDGTFRCYGSSNSAPTMIVSASDGGYHQVKPDGTIGGRYARYNFSQTHYLQRQDERYTAGFFGKLKFNEHAEAYTEFMFMDDNTRGNYAPAGAFFASGNGIDPATNLGNGSLSVNCGAQVGGAPAPYGNPGMNPYLTQNEYNQICNFPAYQYGAGGAGVPAGALALNLLPSGLAQLNMARRNVEGGPRQENFTHTSFRMVAGMRGDINDTWKYDTYGTASMVRLTDWHNNDTSTTRMQNALLAVTDPTTGKVVCSGGQTGCAPWNIWNPSVGPPSAASLSYIGAPGLFQGYTEEDIWDGYVSGDLGKSGVQLSSAHEGLKIVFGAEYRRDHLVTHPDAELETGDLAGNGSPTPPVEGNNHVWEAFTELRLPLIQDMTGAKSLDFEAGYRYSSYSVGFTTNTYKFGVEWTPVSDIKLRSSYNRAVRVPNLQELYNPQHVGLDGGNDPCAAGTFTASAAACALGNPGTLGAPVTPSPAGQYNGIIGGSTALVPEVGTTINAGIVLTPSSFKNFSATLDYTDIKITNLVQNYGSNTILNGCYGGTSPSFCNLIHRDPTGTIWASPQGYVIDPLLNEGSVRNKSWDFGLAYKFGMGKAGDLRTRFDGTYLQSLLFSPAVAGAKPYDCAGFFGPSCAPATPKWRHVLTLDWDTPLDGLSVGVNWRYFGDTKNSTSNPGIQGDYYGDGTIVADPRIASYSYLDLHGSYQWNKVTFRLGINNVLDKDPPLIDCSDSGGNSIYCESNTYPSMYASMGRYLFLNITADF